MSAHMPNLVTIGSGLLETAGVEFHFSTEFHKLASSSLKHSGTNQPVCDVVIIYKC